MGSGSKNRKLAEAILGTLLVLMLLTVIAVVSVFILTAKTPDSHEQGPEEDSAQLLTREEVDAKLQENFQEQESDGNPVAPSDSEEEVPPVEDKDRLSEDEVLPEDEDTVENPVNETVELFLGEMSLHDKICQMILAAPEALTGVETATAAGQMTQEAMSDYPVGGVILFAKNLESKDQTVEMISNLQEYAKEYNGIGLFISVDEEGGKVARVAQRLGTTQLRPMYEYREQGTKTAYENAATIAKDISQFGFNLDFAPVADTWSNTKNTVIGDRAYGDDFEKTAELISSAVEGFHSENIMCTVKHFPGHGDTEEDSHTGSAYVYKTLNELRSKELLPFKAGIRAGADMVMVGHITLPELDSLPASLSSVIITDILRGELEYDGVVITDSLSMKALTDYYGEDKIAVMAVQAGNDILLCQTGMKSMVHALEDAVANGEITEERIDESVRRILILKYEYGLLEELP